MIEVDIAVIGSGSGNSLMTPELGDRSFALIEGGEVFGGTCLNVGCIPTKMFVHTADVAATARRAAPFGVDAQVTGVRWPAIQGRIFDRIDPIARGGEAYRRDSDDVALLRGTARFAGPRELVVALRGGGEEQVRADQVVIATGARAVIPDPLAQAAQRQGITLHTSDTIMRIPTLPRRLGIVGGGFIAAEMAHIFGALGVEVTIVARAEHLLTAMEGCVSEGYTAAARQHHRVLTSRTVADLSRRGEEITLHLDDGREVPVDLILVATGREPQTEALDLSAAGIAVHDDGRIAVDAHGRTSAEGVWALGDVCTPHQLKHVANHHARVVAHNLAHPGDLRDYDLGPVPSAVFGDPQIATVGLTERQAREAGHDVAAYTQSYGDTAWGWALEDASSICHLVADRATGLLLGAHLLGPQAATLIQPLVQAMSTGQRVADIARTQYWIHPAPTEVVENALLGLDVG